MGLFSRFRNENKARDKPRVRVFDRGKVISITRPRADVTLQGHEAIYAAVTRIANTVASIPVHVYKGRERQDTHPLEKLLNLSPNPSMSAYIFKQTMEAFRNTEGMAYALIIRDGLGEITRLDVLDPTRVRPLIERDSREIWYDITLEGKMYPIPGYMVLALKHMSANGISGIRPLDVLRGSLDYDAEVKEISLNQLDGINHGVMLEVPGQALDETRKAQIVADFLDAYESSGQRVLVLEGGIKATTFNQSPVDAQLMDVERITRNRVATVYNLPPHMLGDYSDTSFSTAEQQMQEFLQLTIIPIVQHWEDEAAERRGLQGGLPLPLRHGQPDPRRHGGDGEQVPNGNPRRVDADERGARARRASARSERGRIDVRTRRHPAAHHGGAPGAAADGFHCPK